MAMINRGSWLYSLIKYGKWYLVSSILTKGLSIFLLPVYTSYLSPNDFGILQSLNSIAAFLPFFLSCSLDSAIGRYYHDINKCKEELTSLFSTIFWFVVCYGVFVLIIIFSTSSLWINSLLEVPTFPYAYLAFIPALFNQLGQLGRIYLEQSLETRKVTSLDVLTSIVNAAISVILLVIYNYGVLSRLWGIFIASSLLLLYYVYYFFKKEILKFQFSLKWLKTCLKYSIPLMPAIAGSWIAGLSDRLVIAKYSSLADVGIYSLAYQLSYILYVVGDACTRVLGPLTMSGLVYNKTETKERISRFSFMTLIIMLLVNFGVFLFSKEIIQIFANKEYEDAYKLIPILGFVFIIGVQQRFPMQIISFHKKTWIISLGSIIAGCLNLLLNLWLVPILGYSFAAYSVVFTSLLSIVWAYYWGQKLEYIEYKFRKNIYILIIYFFFFYLSKGLFMIENLIFSFTAKILVLCLLFLIFLLIFDKNFFLRRIK